MRATGIRQLAAAVTLAGWTTLTGAGLFSASGPVIAVFAEELFAGEATGHINGTGTFSIRSQKNPELTCSGQFATDSAKGGSGRMSCSDGSSADFEFRRLGTLRGHGTGTSSRGALSFAYGLTAEEALPYLHTPAGKKLAYNGNRLELLEL